MRFLSRSLAVIGVLAFAWVWAAQSTSPLAPYADLKQHNVLVGDVDGDGTADQMDLERDQSGSSLRLTLSSAGNPERFPVTSDSLTIAALDLDNDNDLDVLVVSRDGRIVVFYNQGNGQFWPKELPSPSKVTGVASVGSLTLAAGTDAPRALALSSTRTIAAVDPSTARLSVLGAPPSISSRASVTLRGPPAFL